MSDQPASQAFPHSPDQHPYPQAGTTQNPYQRPDAHAHQYPPAGYYPPYLQPETNIFAIFSLVFAFFTGILGIIFGHIARHQIKRTGQAGNGLALAGLIIGYAFVGLYILFIIGIFSIGISDPTFWEEV